MAEECGTCTVVRFSRDPSSAKIETLKHVESPDKLTDSANSFGVFYVICIALSIVTYAADLALACILLYLYSVNGHGVYFAVTLSFVVVPALLTTAFNFRWYIVDNDDPSLGRTSLARWVIRVIFLLLQISPLLRYIDTLIYGIKSKIVKKTSIDATHSTFYRKMLDEDTNGALLRLFHCFLHAAPQAIIQLVILLDNASADQMQIISSDIVVLQLWTVLTALISVAWSLTSYHRSVRYSRDDKEKITGSGTTVAFCWQLMSVVSRVLALSMLASVFPAWMGVVVGLHWGVMSVWLALGQQQTAACSNRCEELLLSAGLGLAYVIAFISPRDGPTRYVYLAYYLVCFMENTAALVVWCVENNSSDNPVLYYGAPGAQVIAFLMAITFLLIYYKYCHPCAKRHTMIPDVPDVNAEFDKPGYSKSSYTHRTLS